MLRCGAYSKRGATVDNMYKEKSTKEEVYKAIVDDYTEAISLLPDGLSYKQDAGPHDQIRRYRPSCQNKTLPRIRRKGVANTAEMAEILTELEADSPTVYIP